MFEAASTVRPMTNDTNDVAMFVGSGGFALTDGTVTIRSLREDDIGAVTVAASDAHARKMLRHWLALRGDAPTRRATVRAALLGSWAGRLEPFAVLDRRGKVVGLRFVEPDTPRGVWHCGGWIHPASRGRGYGSAALLLACQHVARNRAGTRIATATRNDNTAAQANLARCGFAVSNTAGPALPDGAGLKDWSRELCYLATLGPIPVVGVVRADGVCLRRP